MIVIYDDDAADVPSNTLEYMDDFSKRRVQYIMMTNLELLRIVSSSDFPVFPHASRLRNMPNPTCTTV